MNEPMNPARPRFKVPPPQFCECSDPGCPVCQGHCRKPARTLVYRSDMEDETGTPMCSGCTEDCMDSGLFYTKESAGHIVVDLLINEVSDLGDTPNYPEEPSPYDAVKLIPAIRYEMHLRGNYEKAKEVVMSNVANNPNYYAFLGEALKPPAHVKGVSNWEKKAGRKVEREHATDAKTADTIASQHHAERKDYYRALKKTGMAPELKKASMLFKPGPSIEPMKEPPGSSADLKLKTPPPKASFYPSNGGPSSI